jgi:acyl-CoA thioester hydrolase
VVLEAEVVIKANFFDLDPMEVVWHGNYARYLEEARCALLDEIGYNYDEMRESGFMWPIVEMRVKYVGPIRFKQEVRVIAKLVEYENRLRINYVIRDLGTDKVLTKAQTTQVAVNIESEEMHLESPTILIDKVRSLL